MYKLLLTIFFYLPSIINPQEISFDENNPNLEVIISEIESQTDLKFAYGEDVNPTTKLVGRFSFEKENLDEVLNQLSRRTPYNMSIIGNNIAISVRSTSKSPKINKSEIQFLVVGKVTDANGLPLPSVTVQEQGTNNGVLTDFDGNFSIEVGSDESVLVFTFIGMQTLRKTVEGNTTMNIQMQEDEQALDEVVVIGYGTVRKSDLTGSVSGIKPEDLLDQPSVNIGEALSGKIPGVEVYSNSGRPGGQINIRIRGNNSITASNEPLYVIDGVIGVADINLINPNNIESLQVLKDASATAIYGSRGANGVILITTKRGLNTDKGVIAYDGWTSFGVLAREQNLEFLNANEWWQVYNTGFDNIAKYDPAGYAQGRFTRVAPENLSKLFDEAGKPLYDTDWEEEVYGKTAISHNHQLSFRGGNEKTTYSATLGYLRQEALMDKNYLERYNGQFNFDSKLRSWLTVGTNVSLNYNKGNDLYSNYGLKRLAQEAIPLIPVKYPDGTYGSNRDFPGGVQDTPSRYLEEMVDQTTNTQAIANLFLDFHITKDLDFKSTFAVDIKSRKNNYYVGRNLIQFGGRNNGGIAQINTEDQLYWQNENYLNWNKQFNQNNRLDFMLGLSWQQRSAELLGAEHRNFIDDFYQWHNLGAGTVNQPSSSNDWRWSLNSYFARANYSLYDKFLFTATGRYDGSSKFGPNNKYAFFPSFAFAWRLSEENFLKENRFINNLKIRTSIGKTGNQEIPNYAYSQNLGSSNIILDNEFYTALNRSSFGNPDLKWETTTQFDGGIDISLLNGRFDMTFDYYYKTTDDLLLNAPIPSTSGLSSVIKNIGSIRNQGLEFGLNSYNITTEDFIWESSIAFAANRNKVLSLGENDEDIFPTTHAQGDMKILRVGEPIGSFWGLTRLGTWNTDEVDEAAIYGRLPGDLKFADLNNDGSIDQNDNSIIGNSSPDWTMGISNRFSYKNLEFSFNIRVVQGNDVMNAATHNREDRSGVAGASKTLLNAWTPNNQNTMIAELRYMRTYYDSYPDTHWLQDGSFIRLQNLMIGYTFKDIGFESLRIYVSGQNLFLITDYNGYDPEVQTFQDGQFGQGIDDFGAPRSKTYTIGLNLNF